MVSMRIVVSLLTAALFVAAAQAKAQQHHRHHQAAVATSSEAGRRPRVSGSAASSSATLIASNVIVFSADPFGSQSPPLGNLWRVFAFCRRLRPDLGAILAASAHSLLTRWWETIGSQGCDRGQLFRCCSNGRVSYSARRKDPMGPRSRNEEAGARPAPFGYARRGCGRATSWRRLCPRAVSSSLCCL
jgi:hypothetical protein